jgi:hypothetical protein
MTNSRAAVTEQPGIPGRRYPRPFRRRDRIAGDMAPVKRQHRLVEA